MTAPYLYTHTILDTRSIVEPAGALAVAGLRKYVSTNRVESTKSLVAVLSGANMNFDRLRFVAERATLGEQKEVFMSVTIPEKAGSFTTLIDRVISPRIVTEFSYRMDDPDYASIYMSFKVTDRASDITDVLTKCAFEGFEAEDISDNEMAKSHARYMIGGKADCLNERIYRFEFPERPGALHKFLIELQNKGKAWNISLFHYRNQGHGKLIFGVQLMFIKMLVRSLLEYRFQMRI